MDGFVELRFKRCLFNDFMRREGASYLTAMFCNAERTLMQKIDAKEVHVQFQLTATLADGDEQCVFKFERMQRLKDMEESLQSV
jgi:hypothetical protein